MAKVQPRLLVRSLLTIPRGQAGIVAFSITLAVEDGLDQGLASGGPFGRDAAFRLIFEVIHVGGVFGFVALLKFLVKTFKGIAAPKLISTVIRWFDDEIPRYPGDDIPLLDSNFFFRPLLPIPHEDSTIPSGGIQSNARLGMNEAAVLDDPSHDGGRAVAGQVVVVVIVVVVVVNAFGLSLLLFGAVIVRPSAVRSRR